MAPPGYSGICGLQRNAAVGDPACRPAVGLAQRIAPLAHGEVAALTMATTPLRLPDLAFADGDGAPKKLSDWRGKTVLVNLWATWCVPCRQGNAGAGCAADQARGPQFRGRRHQHRHPRPGQAEDLPRRTANLTRLGYFNDQKAKVFQDLKSIGRALGMPTSVLVDAQGCEIATIAGPAEWGSDDAVKAWSSAALAPTRLARDLIRPRCSRLPPMPAETLASDAKFC